MDATTAIHPKPTHLVGMLDLHHQRMIARLRNIMDSLNRRACGAGTVTDEIAFLALEIEAYRAFVHGHDRDLRSAIHLDPDMDLRVEADTLYFDVLTLDQTVQMHGERDPDVLCRLSRVGAALLAFANRCQTGVQAARAERVAALRDLLRTASPHMRDSNAPSDPGADGKTVCPV